MRTPAVRFAGGALGSQASPHGARAALLEALALATLGSLFQAACTNHPCSPSYYYTTTLPTSTNSIDCLLTIYGPSATLRYDASPPGPPGQQVDCAALQGAYAGISCIRSSPNGGSAQELHVTAVPQTIDAFQQAIGGMQFTLSLTCGSVSIADHDPQSFGTTCSE